MDHERANASEETPLVGHWPEDSASLSQDTALEFDPKGDKENPREWPSGFKWAIVLLLACMAFTVTFTCISVVPIATQIVADLDNGRPSSTGSALLVTIWELGEAAGPLFIAPLSEAFGRYPVMNAANLLFISATLFAALCTTTPLFVAARALTGLSVAVNVLNPAIIGDMFESEQRGTAMSAVMLAPLIGGAIGPSIGGAITESLGWRMVLYIAVGLAITCEVLFLTCFRETYKVAILKRRAAKLWKEPCSGGPTETPKDKARLETDISKIWHSASRPLAILFGSGVLFSLAMFVSVSFSYFYVMSVSMPDMLRDIYGFSPAQIGLAFIAMSLGSVVAVALCNATLDRVYIKLRDSRSRGNGRPEYRLPLAIFAGLLLPIAISFYGWTAQWKLSVWLLLLASALIDAAALLVMIPLSAYVVDACGIYSASAMTGVIVSRCLMGTFLPLGTGPLVESFGYGWGMMFFGVLSLCLAPVPVLVMRYGEKWRQGSEVMRGV